MESNAEMSNKQNKTDAVETQQRRSREQRNKTHHRENAAGEQ
jgi:hypothetical protein